MAIKNGIRTSTKMASLSSKSLKSKTASKREKSLAGLGLGNRRGKS